MTRSIITVTSAAVSRRLVDPGYARQALELTTDDISDTMLEALIDGASAFVEGWCGRRLIEETVVEEFLLQRPVASLTLSLRPVWATPVVTVLEGTTSLVIDTDWRIDYERGRLTKVGQAYWPRQLWGQYWGPSTVTVTYRGGYTAAEETGGANVPPDLRDGTLELIRDRYDNQSRDPFLRSEEVPGAQSFSYGSGTSTQSSSDSLAGIPLAAATRLRRYRNEVRFA